MPKATAPRGRRTGTVGWAGANVWLFGSQPLRGVLLQFVRAGLVSLLGVWRIFAIGSVAVTIQSGGVLRLSGHHVPPGQRRGRQPWMRNASMFSRASLGPAHPAAWP